MKNSSPATSWSMLKMRVVVCEVLASLRKASISPQENIIVYSALPPTEPMTVSISTGCTPKLSPRNER